jgi:Na+/phosphate symporter
MVITQASFGLIGLPAGIAIMWGAEIGTCSDTLLATFSISPWWTRLREPVAAFVAVVPPSLVVPPLRGVAPPGG